MKEPKFNKIDSGPELLKINNDINRKTVHKILFRLDDKLFVTAIGDESGCTVTIYSVLTKSRLLSSFFKTNKENIKDIGMMCISPDNQYLIVSDKSGLVAIYDISGEPGHEFVDSWLLKNHSCPPTATNIRVIWSLCTQIIESSNKTSRRGNVQSFPERLIANYQICGYTGHFRQKKLYKSFLLPHFISRFLCVFYVIGGSNSTWGKNAFFGGE